jgi:O-antigen/teichoic acid export membrane protein
MIVTGERLKSKALRGGALLGFASTAEHGVRFLRNVILTRILLPEALGVMTIILAINAALEAFTEMGVREAVVQYREAENPFFLNAAWWFAAVRGLILGAIGCLLAWPLARFYHIEPFRDLLLISFLALIFNGATSTKAYLAMREMRYARWAVMMQGSAFVGVGVTLLLLWLVGGILALVCGFVAEAAIRLALSFFLFPFKPSRRFEPEQTREVSRFARGMAGIPLLTFLFLQADIFVLGRIADKYDLGLYGMAQSLASAPTVIISVFINPILMPAIAQIQNQFDRINAALLNATRAMSHVGCLLCAWIILFAPEILRITYGPAYEKAGVVLAILFCAAILRTLASPIPAIFLGIGQPALNRAFAAIRTLIVLALIYPAAFYLGLKGAACTGALAMAVAWLFQAKRLSHVTRLDLGQYRRSVAAGIWGAALVLTGGLLARWEWREALPVAWIAGALSAGVIALAAKPTLRDLGINLAWRRA